jgi:hypothetical protein
MIRCITAGAVVLALAWHAGPAHAQTKLRYQFKAGTKQGQVFDQKMKVAMTVNGMNIDMKIDQSMEISYHVKKVDADGTAHLDVKFDRVKMSVDGFTGVVELDSKDTEEATGPVGKALQQVVRAIAGCDMAMTIAPTGAVKDVALSAASKKKFDELPAGQNGGLGSFTSEGGLKAMAQGGIVFPTEAIAKGKSWTHDRDLDMPFGKLHTTTKYTYEGTEEKDGRKLEKLVFTPEIKLEPDADAPLKINFKNVESKGRALFDNRTGRPVEVASEATMEVTVEVNGMTITQNITQETTIRPKN